MTHPVNIDECEQEIQYLREQNQKLIKELSQMVRENSFLREQILIERTRIREFLERAGIKLPEGEDAGEDDVCLN